MEMQRSWNNQSNRKKGEKKSLYFPIAIKQTIIKCIGLQQPPCIIS